MSTTFFSHLCAYPGSTSLMFEFKFEGPSPEENEKCFRNLRSYILPGFPDWAEKNEQGTIVFFEQMQGRLSTFHMFRLIRISAKHPNVTITLKYYSPPPKKRPIKGLISIQDGTITEFSEKGVCFR